MPNGLPVKNPHFLCVGPEKTGTSWLYHALAGHPDVKMPPVKELRYFYEKFAYPNETLGERFSARGDWHCRDYRAYLAERVRSWVRHPFGPATAWDLRYLFGRRSLEWYVSLFDDEKIAGDVSPQYFSLPDVELASMSRELPGVKIFILLRDPVDWSWSFARMALFKQRDSVPEEELRAFFVRHKAYYPTVDAIERWKRHFSQERVFVGFFDRLCESPELFFAEICAVLGIPAVTPSPAPVNRGVARPMPPAVLAYLREIWLPEIERLCRRYSPYPQRWHAAYA